MDKKSTYPKDTYILDFKTKDGAYAFSMFCGLVLQRKYAYSGNGKQMTIYQIEYDVFWYSVFSIFQYLLKAVRDDSGKKIYPTKETRARENFIGEKVGTV